MIELKLPALGENIETAEVSRLLVGEGDRVEANQNVVELESDKASFPLPCPTAGRVAKIRVKAGDTLKVGQTVLEIEEADAARKSDKSPDDGKIQKTSAAKEEEDEEPEGEEGAREDKNAEEEDKDETRTKEKDRADETKELVRHNRKQPRQERKEAHAQKPDRAEKPAEVEKPSKPANMEESPEKKEPAAELDQPVMAAGPATRKLARELGVNLSDVSGSERDGRITREDVKAFVKRRLTTRAATPAEGVPPLPDFSRWGPVRRLPLNKIARIAAERLGLAWRLAPHVTQHDVVDVTEMEAARQSYLEDHRESGPKITMTVLAIQAAVAALKTYPQFNSSLDSAQDELIVKDYFHIGIAVDTEHGLLVPVVRDADRKTTVQLAEALTELAQKARDRSLALQEMEGGTFTITNLGGIGGTFFTPIINYPEVAILGIGRSYRQAPGDGTPQRLLLPLSLSYDHRVINGADGARFIRKVAELLSSPFRLLLCAK